ncbi:lysosome-associated membrane glycoprotein 2 isoform X2 [Hyperolius riggenbachi]|uniref:lysosome-associated membrane glycoprotein 2 isoform X2 n=1 Tax=Hyperolius riggenbachi TaxID=752182 RepID=UPI0035A3520E
MDRLLCCVTLSLLGLGLLQTNAFDVHVTDLANKTCIYASMKANFTIQYDTNNDTRADVTLQAPDSVNASGSRCGEGTEAPLLMVAFGNGLSWSLNFTKNDTKYSSDVLTFTYNTSDTKLFPDAKRQGLLTSTSHSSFFGAVPLNETYKCDHGDTVISENVQQLYWNVILQAYVQNSTLGNEFRCSADSPTPSPTAHNTTSATTPKPTTKPVDNPAVGNYFVSNGTGKCLLASMGLQINTSLQVDGKNIWTVLNIDPNTTESSGSCGNDSAILRLNDHNATVVEFNFLLKKNNFHLQEVNVTLRNGSATSQTVNSNLSLWDASVGNSYLCHKEQLISVSEDLHINTFSVRVQPFSVQNGTYSTASECYIDEDSILIPIIVGAALSGLIVIIVVAYLIGRRKTHVGYQTL